MKTLNFWLVVFTCFVAVRLHGQGTVNFNNIVGGTVKSPVYGLEMSDSTLAKTGNTTAGTPSGTQVYTGALLSGSGYCAQLFGGTSTTAEADLAEMGSPVFFRTGSAAGFVTAATNGSSIQPGAVAVPGVPENGTAHLQLRAWNNVGGTVTNWTQALGDSSIARGVSPMFTVAGLGGPLTTPPNLVGLLSFNIHTVAASAPIITAQPQSQTVSGGTSTSFSVTATGSSISYQWYKNGSVRNGAVSSVLSFASASDADAASYMVVVSNTAGSVTSSVVSLTLIGPPVITIQPSSVIVNAGDTAIFSVGAGGAAPLTYQWQKDGSNLSDGGNISGTSSASLILSNVATGNLGSYTVIVANTAGTVTSSTAILTNRQSIENEYVISYKGTTGSTDLTPCPPSCFNSGGVSTFGSTLASAATPITIPQNARKSVYGLSTLASWSVTPTNITLFGSNNVPYVFNSLQHTGVYKLYGTHPIAMSSNLVMSVTTSSGSLADTSGNGQTSLTVPFSSHTASDVWLLLGYFTNVEASPTITFSYLSGTVDGTANRWYMDAVRFEYISLFITAQPVSITNAPGSTATFSVTAAGDGPLIYQWQRNGTNLSDGGNIVGTRTATLTLTGVSQVDAASYQVVVSNLFNTLTSSSATLAVTAAPIIATQPVSQTVNSGQNATFNVVANGSSLAYQWQKNGTNISGATSSALLLSSVAASDAASYRVVVTNGSGATTSSSATLTVIDIPVITGQPSSLTKVAGQSATFSVTASGGGLNYQWQKNGSDMSGATSSSLTLASVSQSDAASYQVVVTNSTGAATSSAATLTVIDPPSITSQPASLTRTTGQSASFTVSATGTALKFQWQKNGSNLSGKTSTSLILTNITIADAASYQVVISNAASTVVSSVATLSVMDPPAITTQPASVTQNAGQVATFTVLATGSALNYRWQKNEVNLSNGGNVSGATSATLTLNNLSSADGASYQVVITNSVGSATSTAATLTVVAATGAPAITSQPSSQTANSGATVIFSVSAAGAEPLSYQWRKDGLFVSDNMSISGANTANLSLSPVASSSAGTYSVVVQNAEGSITSSLVTLSINGVRDGGVDPANLGQGGWLYIMSTATNMLGGVVPSVTDEDSLFAYMKGQGLRYVIVKAGTSNMLWTGSSVVSVASPAGAQFTSNLCFYAHKNGLLIFGSNRSGGDTSPTTINTNEINGEIALADYVFNQGADGFIWDAESQWESSNSGLGNNGPALAWYMCSTVRSNWPNKFLAYNPFDTIFLHSSFPYKEFGYWSDCVMPQTYHHAASAGNAFAAVHWTDVQFQTWQNSLTGTSSNINGRTIYWTNSIKPLVQMREVYGTNNGTLYPAQDLLNFVEYLSADPNCVTAGGYHGSDYFRSELYGLGQWDAISASTIDSFPGVVNNLVLDDNKAARSGSWTMQKTISATTSTVTFSGATGTDTNSFGTNYWYKTQGDGTSYMQFTPNIVVAGDYNVYQWHPFRSIASTNVPFAITDATGTTTVFANQQTNSGNWSWLGKFSFVAGTNGSIRVSDNVPEAGAIAMADAIKLTFVPAIPAPTTPAGLSATGVNSSSIHLSWVDTSTNATGFIVSRSSTSGGMYSDVAVLGMTTSFDDTGLTSGTTYYYVVRAINSTGASGNSTEASGTTLAPPSISTQPASQTVKLGADVVLSVGASGSVPLSYQWQQNGVTLVESDRIIGGTTASLTLQNVSGTDSGTYSVIVTNSEGTITSAPANLLVIDAVITADPTDMLGVAGNTVALSVGATSSLPLFYQWWFKAADSLAGFTQVTGATNASLTLANLYANKVGSYFVTVSNQFAPISMVLTSAVAQVSLGAAPQITSQPANFTGTTARIAGRTASFAVTASGTAPLQYQWYHNDAVIVGATKSGWIQANVQSIDAGTYTCAVSNRTGFISTSLSARGLLEVLPDAMNPLPVALFTPVAGARFTNGMTYVVGNSAAVAPVFTLAGRTLDNGLVTNVVIERVFPPSAPLTTNAVLSDIPADKQQWTNVFTLIDGSHFTAIRQFFTNVLELVDGTNTFRFTARDTAGRSSAPANISFFYVNTSRLTLATNIPGSGSITPVGLGSVLLAFGTPTNQALLEIGRNYTLLAKPVPGNIFSNWTILDNVGNTTYSGANPLTFSMKSNLTLTANFVANPVLVATGQYNGLFYETNELGAPNMKTNSAGMLGKLTVSSSRLFTANIALDGSSLPVTGTFDLTGDWQGIVSRAAMGRPNLAVQLHLAWDADPPQITGSISNISLSDPWYSPLQADLAFFSAAHPTNANRYTMSIPQAADAPSASPGGDSFAIITNRPDGTIILNGRLIDGTSLFQAVPMSKNGRMPLFMRLYNRGLIGGWVDLSSGSPVGLVSWLRPAGSSPLSYVNGFNATNLAVTGSVYSVTGPALSNTNLVVEITDTNIVAGAPLTWNVQLRPNNSFVVVRGADSATNLLTGSILTSSGSFTLRFRQTLGTSANDITAYGVVDQTGNVGRGGFLGPVRATPSVLNSGGIYIHP